MISPIVVDASRHVTLRPIMAMLCMVVNQVHHLPMAVTKCIQI